MFQHFWIDGVFTLSLEGKGDNSESGYPLNADVSAVYDFAE